MVCKKRREKMSMSCSVQVGAFVPGWSKVPDQSIISPETLAALEGTGCAICTELILDPSNSPFEILSCGHAYHADCLENLINSGGTICPECRQLIAKSILDKFPQAPAPTVPGPLLTPTPADPEAPANPEGRRIIEEEIRRLNRTYVNPFQAYRGPVRISLSLYSCDSELRRR